MKKIVDNNKDIFLFTLKSFCLLQLDSFEYKQGKKSWLWPMSFSCLASKMMLMNEQPLEKGCFSLALTIIAMQNNKITISKETPLSGILHQLLLTKGDLSRKKEEINISQNLPLAVFCINRTANECYDFVRILVPLNVK